LKSQENNTQLESSQSDSKVGVTIEVNKNIELVAIAYFLTDLGFKKNTHCYSFQVNHYFKKNKNHKAIHHLKSFLTKKNADMGFVGLGEFISNEFKFMPELMSQDDYNYYNTLYGMENIIEFFVLLKDFKAISNYDSFYKKNESIYQEWASKFGLLLAKNNTINSYQSYFKETYAWKIYLSPLYGGAHAIMRDNGYNSKNKTFIYGPTFWKKNKNKPVDFLLNTATIYHEASHFIVSGFTYGIYKKKIDEINYLFEPIEKLVKKNRGYDRWIYAFDEMLVNSITMAITESKSKGNRKNLNNIWLTDHMSKGLIYEYHMLTTIQEMYRTNQKIDATIIPEILALMRKISIEELKKDTQFNIKVLKKTMRKHWRSI
jgi:hypothetical protein